MIKVFGELRFDSSFMERFELLEQRLINVENLIKSKIPAVKDDREPIPQKTAMGLLGTSFQTFKKLIFEFRVRPIIRGGRIFYHHSDILRIQNGLKR